MKNFMDLFAQDVVEFSPLCEPGLYVGKCVSAVISDSHHRFDGTEDDDDQKEFADATVEYNLKFLAESGSSITHGFAMLGYANAEIIPAELLTNDKLKIQFHEEFGYAYINGVAGNNPRLLLTEEGKLVVLKDHTGPLAPINLSKESTNRKIRILSVEKIKNAVNKWNQTITALGVVEKGQSAEQAIARINELQPACGFAVRESKELRGKVYKEVHYVNTVQQMLAKINAEADKKSENGDFDFMKG